jgi:hypothetical protein
MIFIRIYRHSEQKILHHGKGIKSEHTNSQANKTVCRASERSERAETIDIATRGNRKTQAGLRQDRGFESLLRHTLFFFIWLK